MTDIALGIAWAGVALGLDLSLWASAVLLLASQALVVWGLAGCLRGWRGVGAAGRVLVVLVVGAALVEAAVVVVLASAAAGQL